MYKEVFSPRLKKAREYNGLTQREVAKTLRISNSTYAKYETGANEPSLQMLAMLAKLFGVSTDWLLGLSSESPIGSLKQLKEEQERQKILRQLEKEAELSQRVWGIG